MKLTDLLIVYIDKRLKGKSPNTVRLYNHSIRSFEKSLGRTAMLADLTDENLERHMSRMVINGGSPCSANKDHGQLTALWRFAHHNRVVDTWPNVRTLPEPERVPMGWLPHELTSLFDAIAKLDGFVGDAPARLWWSALIRVLLDTGERIGAVRQMTRNNLEDVWLRIPAEFRKGRRRDKLYPLQQQTISDIRLLMQHNKDSKMMFPWDRCETYIYNRLNTILETAGLPTDRRSKFHRVRRTVASAVARSGGDATAALDHASPRTTKRYLDPRIVGGTSTAQILSGYLSLQIGSGKHNKLS